MALSEYERTAINAIKDQWGTAQDAKEWLDYWRKQERKRPTLWPEKPENLPIEETPTPAPEQNAVMKTLSTVSWIWEKIWWAISWAWEKFKMQPKEWEGIWTSVWKFIVNIPWGAVSLLWDTVSAISNPVKVVEWLKQAWKAWVEAWLNTIFNTSWWKTLLQWLWASEESIKELETWKYTSEETKQVAEWLKNTLVQNFWSLEKARQTIVKNPEDVLSILIPSKTLSRISWLYKPTSKISKLEKSAWVRVWEFLAPTKTTTKQISTKITPWILEKGIKWTREQVLTMAENKVTEIWKQIDDFMTSWKLKWEVKLDKLVETLAKADSELRFEGKILPWNESQANFIKKQINFLSDLEKKWNTLTPDQQVILRRSFDKVFDKTVTRDNITKFQDDLQVKLADTLRSELAKNNPDFDVLNKNFSFYKWLENVLNETQLRKTWQLEEWLVATLSKWQSTWIWATAWWTIWWFVAWPAWVPAWAFIWWAIWNKLQKVLSSPERRLMSAQSAKKLADALAKWDLTTIDKILNSIIVLWQTNKTKKDKNAMDVLFPNQ